ncbi:MAG: hypothetical protein V3T70_01900, partial [Phycisphaerae bacterium]
QLAGWRIAFDDSLVCPAEVPCDMASVRIQQRRWARGSLQTAVKLLGRLWRAPVGLRRKLAGTMHLLGYTMAFWMLGAALLAAPSFIALAPYARSRALWPVWLVIGLGALAPARVHLAAAAKLGRLRSAIRDVPGLMVLGAGLCFDNSLVGLSGLFRSGGTFERTPKTGSRASRVRTRGEFIRPSATRLVELLLAAYCAWSTAVFAAAGLWLPAAFLGLYTTGFLTAGLSPWRFALAWRSRERSSGMSDPQLAMSSACAEPVRRSCLRA